MFLVFLGGNFSSSDLDRGKDYWTPKLLNLWFIPMHFTCLLPLLLADVNEVAWQLPGLFVGDDSDGTLHGKNVGNAQVVGNFNLDEMLILFFIAMFA
jgi:hypothetical protein